MAVREFVFTRKNEGDVYNVAQYTYLLILFQKVEELILSNMKSENDTSTSLCN